jgi:quinol monooxygenase YgiN
MLDLRFAPIGSRSRTYAVWQDETCVEKHWTMKHSLAFKNVASDLLEGPVLVNKWRIVG